ncbi:MAG: hypothetical protein QME52_04020 [Bacteroidota bacterium]|nr:hypothetical protein [Bacteroidota bacterium]
MYIRIIAKISSIILLTLFLSASLTSYLIAGLNLPQSHYQVSIKGKDHAQLKNYFEPLTGTPGQIDDKIEQLITRYFPKEYKDGCTQMISAWREVAKGTASTVLRVLYLKNHDKNLQQVLLVFTCFSGTKEYGDKFYDERLVLLTIDNLSSQLKFIPHSKPCDNCSELTRIGLEEEMQIHGISSISIIMLISNENPCCDGPDIFKEEIKKYFTFEVNGVREVLSFVTNRTETLHDDIAGDSTTVYKTDINVDKDKQENINKITISWELLVNDIPKKNGLQWYTWNRKARRFE